MKIAIDIRSAAGNKAGKGWYTYQLVRGLLSQDTENNYLLYTHEEQNDFTEFANAEQRVIKTGGLKWHLKVVKDLKSQKPDLFIAPSSYIIPALAPKNLKTLIVVHDLIAFLFPKNHNKKATIVEKATLKRAVKRSSQIITVSQNTKKDLLKKFKISTEKIEVVYPAVSSLYKDIDKPLESWREHHHLPKDFFLFVGTLEPRKNIEALLEAHAQLIDPKKKKREQPHLVIIGARGWKFSKIFKKLDQLKTAEYVQFKGYTEEKDLVNYYNSAIALVFPSLYEGFGLPPLEAMKSGCSVITSNVSALPEVVGKAALLVSPKDTKGLAKAMKRVYDDVEVKMKLIVEGFKQADTFSWQKTAKQFLKIINGQKG